VSLEIKKGKPMEHLPDNRPAPTQEKGSRNLLWSLALLAMLVVGLASGYLIGQAQNRPIQVVVTATSEPSRQAVAQTETQPPTKPVATAATTGNENTPPTPTIMDFVLSDARHFQGSDDAPITMIEFSDFK
jgi:uncharacterized protein HemX